MLQCGKICFADPCVSLSFSLFRFPFDCFDFVYQWCFNYTIRVASRVASVSAYRTLFQQCFIHRVDFLLSYLLCLDFHLYICQTFPFNNHINKIYILCFVLLCIFCVVCSRYSLFANITPWCIAFSLPVFALSFVGSFDLVRYVLMLSLPRACLLRVVPNAKIYGKRLVNVARYHTLLRCTRYITLT